MSKINIRILTSVAAISIAAMQIVWADEHTGHSKKESKNKTAKSSATKPGNSPQPPANRKEPKAPSASTPAAQTPPSPKSNPPAAPANKPQPAAAPTPVATPPAAPAAPAPAPQPAPDPMQKLAEGMAKTASSTKQQIQEINTMEPGKLLDKHKELLQDQVNKATDLDQAYTELKRLNALATPNLDAVHVQLERIITDTAALTSTNRLLSSIEQKSIVK